MENETEFYNIGATWSDQNEMRMAKKRWIEFSARNHYYLSIFSWNDSEIKYLIEAEQSFMLTF